MVKSLLEDIEGNVINFPVDAVKVLDKRYREDMGDIKSLAASIEVIGYNIVPIIITEDGTLIAGERRLRAHKQLGKTTIRAIIETGDALDHKLLEILENKERKQFTWQEDVIATEDMHNLLVAKYGDKWSLRKTAEEINASAGNISVDIQLAKAMKESPDLFEGCRTKEQAYKALKKNEIEKCEAELAKRRSKTTYHQKATNHIFHRDCILGLEAVPANFINVCISDPVFGIDFFQQRLNVQGSDLPREQQAQFDDSEKSFKDTLTKIFPLLDKVMKEDSAILLFCGFTHAQWLIDQLTQIGFQMDMLPAIWAKKGFQGRTNCPDAFFNRTYEMMVYGSRGTYSLVRQGTGNVLYFENTPSADRTHPNQKPAPLIEEIINRMCLPGYVILDFMTGSGVIPTMAVKKGCIPLAFEIDEKWYNEAIKNLAQALEMKDNGLGENIR